MPSKKKPVGAVKKVQWFEVTVRVALTHPIDPPTAEMAAEIVQAAIDVRAGEIREADDFLQIDDSVDCTAVPVQGP